MQRSLSRIIIFSLLPLAGWQASPIQAQQTQVFVGAGQTLTDIELSSGSFLGQDFVLQPNTIFEIEAGGVLGPVSNPTANTGQPFDFAGSTVNVNAGGRLGGKNVSLNEVGNLTLNLFDDGEITNSLVAFGGTVNIAGGSTQFVEVEAGGTLNVTGGIIPHSSRAQDSTVNISGGSLGYQLTLYRSDANVSGGNVTSIEAYDDSIINISGGIVGSLSSLRGGTVNLTGGTIERPSSIFTTLNASGGTIGRRFVSGIGGTTFTGGEFYLNGMPYTQSTLSFVEGQDTTFSGTFADGTPFVFSQAQDDELTNVTLVSTTLPTLVTTPIVVDGNSSPAPNGLRRGQSLTLNPGGTLNSNTAVVGATLTVDGGHVGDRVDAYQSTIQLRSGTISHNFHLLAGSTLEVTGGTVDRFIDTFAGSTTNISGGRIAGSFRINDGSTVAVTGGNFGDGFVTGFGSPNVSFSGGEFKLNGVPFTEDSISISSDETFTGTFEDGSPFIFSGSTRDFFRNVQLIPASLPAIDLTPITVSQPNSPVPTGLRQGQTLTLQSGGTLPVNFESVDATLNMAGGTVSDSLKIAGGEANISGGQIGNNAAALFGSTVNISGGSIGDFFQAAAGSTINITGGQIGERFTAEPGSIVSLSGGKIGPAFRAEHGAILNLLGGEFMLNGVPYTESTLGNVDLRLSVFSGTLSDGTTFVFGGRFPDLRLPDRIAPAHLIPTQLPEINLTPMVADGTTSAPKGLRNGQTLRLAAGGSLPDNFAAIGGHLLIDGGTVGANMQLVGTNFEMTGGSIATNLDVRIGSTVNISGGTVEDLTAFSGGTVNIFGGQVGAAHAGTGGILNILGGEIGRVSLSRDSTVNISGGTFDQISASSGTINLFVTEFLIDGLPASLQPNMPVNFRTEFSTLYSALLLDGSRLEFTGSNVRSSTNLIVTLIPEPSSLLLIASALFATLRTSLLRGVTTIGTKLYAKG